MVSCLEVCDGVRERGDSVVVIGRGLVEKKRRRGEVTRCGMGWGLVCGY